MLELIVRNKFFSIKGKSVVYDLDGKPYFNVDGKFLTFTAKKFVNDLEGNTIYTVRNKFWHILFKSAYIYDKDENLVAQVKRKFALKSKFNIFGPKDNYHIDGTIFGWNFTIYRNDQVVGRISRHLNLVDEFQLSIPDEKDAPLFVAFVIALDNVTDRENNSSAAFFSNN